MFRVSLIDKSAICLFGLMILVAIRYTRLSNRVSADRFLKKSTNEFITFFLRTI